MTISEINKGIKEIRDKHSLYGLECILTAVAYAYKDHDYVDRDYMLDLFAHCIDRASKPLYDEAHKLGAIRYIDTDSVIVKEEQ